MHSSFKAISHIIRFNFFSNIDWNKNIWKSSNISKGPNLYNSHVNFDIFPFKASAKLMVAIKIIKSNLNQIIFYLNLLEYYINPECNL